MNYLHPLFPKSIPIGSHGMEYSTLLHKMLLTMYRDCIIHDRILIPGFDMVELGLVVGTQLMNNTQRKIKICVELNGIIVLDYLKLVCKVK